MKLLFRKRRRYPIRRDKTGRSMRQQAFELFEQGSRPSDIYKQKLVPASPRTLFRYYEDWKYENNHPSDSAIKKIVSQDPILTQDFIDGLSQQLRMPVAEVVARARPPWGMLQLFGEYLFGNPPGVVDSLIADIMLLKDNSGLFIRKERGIIYVTTRDENGQIVEKRLKCRP